MLDLLPACLITFGFAYIIGRSEASWPVRRVLLGDAKSRWRTLLVDLIECPACLGFWIGVVPSLLGHRVLPFGGSVIQHAIATGCFFAATNFLLYSWSAWSKNG